MVEVPDEPATPAPASRARPVSEGLPVGTRVLKPGVPGRSHPRHGTVMPHQPEYSGGSFPVRFDDQLWEVLDTTYVTPVSMDTTVAVAATTRSARRARVA